MKYLVVFSTYLQDQHSTVSRRAGMKMIKYCQYWRLIRWQRGPGKKHLSMTVNLQIEILSDTNFLFSGFQVRGGQGWPWSGEGEQREETMFRSTPTWYNHDQLTCDVMSTVVTSLRAQVSTAPDNVVVRVVMRGGWGQLCEVRLDHCQRWSRVTRVVPGLLVTTGQLTLATVLLMNQVWLQHKLISGTHHIHTDKREIIWTFIVIHVKHQQSLLQQFSHEHLKLEIKCFNLKEDQCEMKNIFLFSINGSLFPTVQCPVFHLLSHVWPVSTASHLHRDK